MQGICLESLSVGSGSPMSYHVTQYVGADLSSVKLWVWNLFFFPIYVHLQKIFEAGEQKSAELRFSAVAGE